MTEIQPLSSGDSWLSPKWTRELPGAREEGLVTEGKWQGAEGAGAQPGATRAALFCHQLLFGAECALRSAESSPAPQSSQGSATRLEHTGQ